VVAADGNDEKVDRWIARHPPADDISPEKFEQFVAELLGAGGQGLEDYRVETHEVLEGFDGSYDFDATVRFSVLGMDYLVLVEDKRHTHPIKRELVQVLHRKLQSVGAQKAVMISTAPFQRGAIEFAKTHGIALAMVSEGRLHFETRTALPRPMMSREEAQEKYGLPTFVAVCFGPGDKPGSTTITTIDPDDSTRIQVTIFGIKLDRPEARTR
jgi:Restriction endonuclease